MRAEALGERDGWDCWLCGGEVDRDAPPGSPWTPTVDHVVPKSRGGKTEPSNLRLAHRRCNSARGNRATELAWPDDFGLLDAPALWPSLGRIVRRGGQAQVVALAPTLEVAEQAAAWVVGTATTFLGGDWTALPDPTGVDDCHVIRLSVTGDVADPGRPRTD